MTAVVYADASALGKLVNDEAESEPARAYLGEASLVVSSKIVEVELGRVALRSDRPAGAVLDSVTLLELTPDVRRLAAGLRPPALRALDAIHLATFLSMPDRPAAFVAYDRRLLRAAETLGLPTASPA